MRAVETVLFLVILATVVATFARRWRLPAPSLLVIAGVVIGLLPGVPTIVVTPDIVSLVVLPPLAEETAMRGFLYTGLKRLFPWTVSGMLVSLLFGAAHLAEGGASGPLWIGAIDTFTLSLVLVFLREKTGNLWAGVALHATKNFVAFYALFIIGGR